LKNYAQGVFATISCELYCRPAVLKNKGKQETSTGTCDRRAVITEFILAKQRCTCFNQAMRKAPISIITLKKRLAPVFQRYGVQKAFVFGSIARGEASTRSDVDLIIVQPTTKRFFDRYDGLLLDMNTAVRDKPVEAFIYTPEEMASIRQRPFIKKALAEGAVIYERHQKPA